MVLWITGLSASGKTTIGKAFLEISKGEGSPKVFLDGDSIRELFGADLDYDERSRILHIGRIQRLAKFLEDQGIDVVVAALYSNEEILAENRRLFNNYFEVYLKADIEYLKLRENKSLYTKSENNEIKNVVGVDIQWHEPKSSNLIIATNELSPPISLALAIRNAINVNKVNQ